MFRGLSLRTTTTKMLRNPRVTLLFARVSTSPITSISRCRPVPGCCHFLVGSRSFSFSSRLSKAPVDEPPAWAGLREIVRPSAMWLVPDGSKFDQQQVLDQLPELGEQSKELPVVFVLVTPKLAHLFEDKHPFHASVVNTIYGKSTQGDLRQSIVAVVDALPVLGKFRGAAKSEIHGVEGIAVCISPGFDVQPATEKENRQPVISMTARHPFYDGRRHVTFSWSGGVANTTFINGRQHTLFMQNWHNPDSQKWSPGSKRQTLRHVDVQAYNNRGDATDYLSVVLYSNIIKLTDPKVIRSSMGNIVRQVETPKGEMLAASHELETIVPKMLKELQKTTPTGDLRVFALVYPPEIGAKDNFKDCVWTEKIQQTALRKRRYNINMLTLLLRGARLYRVTSGGAGWGKKAGLLSLEPITELGGSAVEPEFPSFIFEQTQDIRMPGSADLFPPGYVIQFIGTFHDAEGLKKNAVSTEHAERLALRYSESGPDWTDPDNGQQLCLGTTVLPETHQYTSLEDVDRSSISDTSESESTSQDLIFRANRFGFLTTSALGLSTRYHSPSQNIKNLMTYGSHTLVNSEAETNYRHSSLIELPNSYLLTKFPAGGKVVKEAAKYYTGSESSEEPWTKINSATSTSELTEDESVLFASQRLRDAERLQNASYRARKQTFTRKVVTMGEKATRVVNAEISPVRRSSGQPSHEALIRHVETTKKDIDDSLSIVTKELIAMKSLGPGQAKRLRRFMDYRSTQLGEGKPVNLNVVSDAVWQEDGSLWYPRRIPLRFRYTITELPEGLSEIFTNESLGSEDRRTEIDEEQESQRNLNDADLDEIVKFKPFKPDPILPARPVVSVRSYEKHDLTSLLQNSTIFRSFHETEGSGEDDEGRIKSDKVRKIIRALMTDL